MNSGTHLAPRNPASGCRTRQRLACLMALAVLTAGLAHGQAPPPADPTNNAPVTRAEYEALKAQMEQTRQEMAELRKQKAAATPANADDVNNLKLEIAKLKKDSDQRAEENAAYQDETTKIMKEIKQRSEMAAAGTTKLLITGDAAVGFQAYHNSNSTFSAGVAPRFLWELNDRILFDAAFDISTDSDGANGSKTNFDLTIANVSYIVNDYLIVGAGQFVVPFGQYHTHFDPPWINPLPDDPLVFSSGGLTPSSQLGVFANGAIPIKSTKLVYAVYATNGSTLEPNANNSTNQGSLHFDNSVDQNNNKALGGRIGFMPVPELEMGFSIMHQQVSDKAPTANNPESGSVNNALYAVDMSYRRQFAEIAGTFHIRGEYVWSHTTDFTYTDAAGNPLNFNNNATGGYALVSYRPSMVSNKILRNTEFVFRYDRLDAQQLTTSNTDSKGNPVTVGGQEQRYTLGLDYWFDPRVVLKTAYECDDIAHAGGNPAFVVQIGVGF